MEGKGRVCTSNVFTLGIDELFGVYDGEAIYISKSENVTLDEGDTIEITDVTVEMVKSK